MEQDYLSFRRENRMNFKKKTKAAHQSVENAEVFCCIDTIQYVNQTKYLKLDGKGCVKYEFYVTNSDPIVKNEKPIIQVLKEDTLNAAQKIYDSCEDDEKLAILNMASDYKPGGGWERGAKAQEEAIARRSNLVSSLNKKFYPIKLNELLYSPCVTVFKDDSYNQCNEFECAVITCAAIRKPNLIKDREYRVKDFTLMHDKIKTILEVAILNKVDHLVLGAFGCGAFGNPVKQVADIFYYYLVEQGYAKYFKSVSFAILVAKEEDEKNFICFEQKFKN